MEQVVFAHVSDPHFGDPIFDSDAAHRYGQHGHDLEHCQEIPNALEQLRALTNYPSGQTLPVVMTGDLTRIGLLPNEFANGNDYFLAEWQNPSGLPSGQYGLRLGPKHYVRIPGNHDHWDGNTKNQWALMRPLSPRTFPIRYSTNVLLIPPSIQAHNPNFSSSYLASTPTRDSRRSDSERTAAPAEEFTTTRLMLK